tara:strand:- start:32 stop:1138 length:1107 start_codon:yes stop_codon:yes gene_type:complete
MKHKQASKGKLDAFWQRAGFKRLGAGGAFLTASSISPPAKQHATGNVNKSRTQKTIACEGMGSGAPSEACPRSPRSQTAEQQSTREKTPPMSRGGSGVNTHDDRMVRSDKDKATLRNLMDALCEANAELSYQVVDTGRAGPKSRLTLGKILRRVALRVHGKNIPLSGVYKLTNTTNGKAYVGQTVDIAMRWYSHKSACLSGKKDGCRYLQNAVRKHGWASFRKEILLLCDKSELSTEEKRLIAEHDTLKPNGYNITPGGDASPFVSREVTERAAVSKRATWNERFEAKLNELSQDEAARQRRKRDARLRAKSRYKARQRGEHVEEISIKDANAARIAASNSEYSTMLRKATYARKRESKLTGNFLANS